MPSRFKIGLLCLVTLISLAGCESAEVPALDPDNPTFDAVIANSDHFPGLIDSYRVKDSGALYMRFKPEHLERDYLYFGTFLDGNSATNTQRGIFGSHRVLRLRRDFQVLEVQQLNTRFFFDPDSALARSAEANLPPTVLAVADIVDENDAGELLVHMGPIFLDESLQQIKPAADPEADPKAEFVLGELSETRSSLQQVKAYPENIDLIVNYVYENPAPLVRADAAVTDSRFVSVRLQHTLIPAPEEDFKPRFADARLGYFAEQVTDMTSYAVAPWRDPIDRWKLVKKEPGAALSEPVEPILFWLENTTPEAYRDTVREAVLVWNQAFESAGFKDAIEVRIQPDDAEWDAGDLRYNVLRWTSSSESTWGGYGPSWPDPRTGQILGADIMLEFGWITSHLRSDQLFEQAMLPALDAAPLRSRLCLAGDHMKSQLMLGRSLLGVKPGSAEDSELVRQSLYDLVSHEVGHTLGLNHNFRASQLLTPEQLAQPEVVAEQGVASSVMDYLAINFAPLGAEQAAYYPTSPGPYDHWVIEYGYSEALADPVAEEARLQAILQRSTEAEMGFGLDADVMASSGSGIDPRVMLFDQSSDPLRYASDRLALIDSVGASLLQRYQAAGESWQALYDAYLSLTSEQARQFWVASRWVGGLYVERAVQEQPGATEPLRPVELERQQQAMTLFREQLFAPDALRWQAELYRHLQRQRRGNNHWNQPQDPQLHARVLATQQGVLAHLLHPVVQTRISDSALYGNEYSLSQMMSDLNVAIFASDSRGPVNSMRQQLQRDYVERLLLIVDPAQNADYDYLSRNAALYQLQQISSQLVLAADDTSTRAHRAALKHRIETGLKPAA
ncbi:MAG: zinc-dependent metalloprotease [Halieaceae bacterium]